MAEAVAYSALARTESRGSHQRTDHPQRDDVRRFVKGDPGLLGAVAQRLGGSADVYEQRGQSPENSINFVTVHDGFTLADAVTYAGKNNAANGEGNRDGDNNNYSCNYGFEGPTRRTKVNEVRERQVRNMLATLLLSQGVPMVLMGDECRRTQRGNNNAYCQDNEISWLDWALDGPRTALLDFVRSGKGLVVYHFTMQSFEGWTEFEKIAGANWRPNFGHHSAPHDFTIDVKDTEHPITKGLKLKFDQQKDELYANLKWQPAGPYRILATAYDDHALYAASRTDARAPQPLVGAGANENMLWTVDYGKGRVFTTALGHVAPNLATPAFQVTFARGVEWAATGKVTQAIPPWAQAVEPLVNVPLAITSTLSRSARASGAKQLRKISSTLGSSSMPNQMMISGR